MKTLLRVVLAHAAALLLMIWLGPSLSLQPSNHLIVQGSLAGLIGRLLQLPYWWLPINLLLPLGAGFLLDLALPPWVYLLSFMLLLLVQWNSASERVPLYLSNPSTWQAIAEQLPVDQPFRFIDLGSGLGGTLFYLAKRFPNAEFYGVESAPLPFVLAWLRKLSQRQTNLHLHYGSLWAVDPGDFDVFYAFLSPAPMDKLYHHLHALGKPDSLLISNSFPVPEVEADEVLQLADGRKTRLYLYRPCGDRNEQELSTP